MYHIIVCKFILCTDSKLYAIIGLGRAVMHTSIFETNGSILESRVLLHDIELKFYH